MTVPGRMRLAAGLLSGIGLATPVTGQTATPVTAPAEPDRMAAIERGRYIAERVAMCIECHSGRDASGAIIPRERFMGGPLPFRPPAGWADRAPRIAGLLGYSDAEALNVLMRGALGRHGAVLRPPMPRLRMTEADARAVITFLRSMP
jgi:hypothetical protein